MPSTKAKLHGSLPKLTGSALVPKPGMYANPSTIKAQALARKAVASWSGQSNPVTFTDSPATVLQFLDWTRLGASGTSMGTGKSLLDKNYTFIYASNSSGIVYTRDAITIYCDAIIGGAPGAELTHVVHDWTGLSSSVSYRRSKYVDLYVWGGTSYVLVQTFTSTEVHGAYKQVFPITAQKPKFDSSGQMRVRAQTRMYLGNDGLPYLYCAEIGLVTRTYGAT